jgi:hypothetical protein
VKVVDLADRVYSRDIRTLEAREWEIWEEYRKRLLVLQSARGKEEIKKARRRATAAARAHGRILERIMFTHRTKIHEEARRG